MPCALMSDVPRIFVLPRLVARITIGAMSLCKGAQDMSKGCAQGAYPECVTAILFQIETLACAGFSASPSTPPSPNAIEREARGERANLKGTIEKTEALDVEHVHFVNEKHL